MARLAKVSSVSKTFSPVLLKITLKWETTEYPYYHTACNYQSTMLVFLDFRYLQSSFAMTNHNTLQACDSRHRFTSYKYVLILIFIVR